MKFDKDHEMKIGVVAIAVFLIFFSVIGFDKFYYILTPIQEIQDFFNDTYTSIGLVTIFLYEFIPDGFKFVSDAGFYGNLLVAGVPAWILVIIPALGHLGGQFIMYSVGRLNIKWFKKSDFAGPNHIMHRHKLIIFFVVPFGGMLGTFIMILAGHQKINFFKIIPILMIANIIHMATFVYPFIFEFNLGT